MPFIDLIDSLYRHPVAKMSDVRHTHLVHRSPREVQQEAIGDSTLSQYLVTEVSPQDDNLTVKKRKRGTVKSESPDLPEMGTANKRMTLTGPSSRSPQTEFENDTDTLMRDTQSIQEAEGSHIGNAESCEPMSTSSRRISHKKPQDGPGSLTDSDNSDAELDSVRVMSDGDSRAVSPSHEDNEPMPSRNDPSGDIQSLIDHMCGAELSELRGSENGEGSKMNAETESDEEEDEKGFRLEPWNGRFRGISPQPTVDNVHGTVSD
ncbi:MAG: hypothetical protein TREMPRED_002043 [Tremellales sp. Tagirdzhanova-0007]|nr:MAG: hypothetical protein TREMPRED_002043 [Tremellales sp. Tagirdzhanova-0007]